MEQTILTSWQKDMLKLASKKKELANFYLSGGTALAAFYLHHRLSDDLDFFSFEQVDGMTVERIVADLAQTMGARTRFEKIHDRRLFFLEKEEMKLKVEFSYYPFRQLSAMKLVDGIRIDSLRDISANKLAALLDRFDPKDFVDLYFLLQQKTLESIWKDTQKKFRLTISPLFLGSELAKVSRIKSLPRMMTPLTVEELRSFFSDQAKKLLPNVLDI